MARIIDAFTQFFDNAGDPLINGKLKFLEPGTNNTDKDTFADAGLSVPNTNPVPLDGAGRSPSVFGQGVYKAILLTSDDQQIEQFDPVGGDTDNSQFDDYVLSTTYNKGDIVRASDDESYRSIINGNQGNDPALEGSPEQWELLQFGRVWNTNITYTNTSSVYGNNGILYLSLINGNIGNNPATDTGVNWTSGGSLFGGGEQLDYSAETVIPEDSKVITLNPASAGLVATLSTTEEGDIKRLINISAFSTFIKFSGSGLLELDPNQTIAANKVGADWFANLDDNETLEAVILGSLSAGGVFTATNPLGLVAAQINDNQIIMAYRDGTTGFGSTLIADITAGVVTFGSTVVFNGANTDSISVGRITDTKFIITYQDQGNSNFGTSIVGDVSGSTVTMGSEQVFNSSTTTETKVKALDTGSIAIAYVDNGNGSFGTSIIGTVSGTTVTFGSETVFNSAVTSSPAMSVLDATNLVISYSDTGNSGFGTSIVGVVTGTTVVFGSEFVFESASSIRIQSQTITSTQIAIAYTDNGNSGFGTAIIADITGSSIAYGTAFVYSSANTSNNNMILLPDGSFVISFTVSAPLNPTIVISKITGTDIAFDDPSTFTEMTVNGHVIVSSAINYSYVYRDSLNSNFGTVRTGDIITL